MKSYIDNKLWSIFANKILGKIVALDFGRVRTGVAVTDELQLIASGLCTVETTKLLSFLKEYEAKESIETIVVGEPKQMNNLPSESEKFILPFIENLRTQFPEIPVVRQDERFTSRLAMRSLVESGVKKKKRRDKALVDEVSATLILQAYLDQKSNK